MKKICFLTNTPTLIPRQKLQTRALRESGHELSAICWDRDGVCAKEELTEGIRFLRIQPTYHKGRVRRPTSDQSLVSFWGDADRGLHAALWLGRLWIKTFQKALAQNADIFVCCHYVSLPLAVCAARIRGAKVVYDISEFSMEHTSYWLPKMLRPLSSWLQLSENMLIRQIAGVTCVPDRKLTIYRRAFKNCRNTEVVLNVPELELRVDTALLNALKKKYAEKNVLVYAGALIQSKGIMEAVKAVKVIRSLYPNFVLLLIGSCIGDDTALITDYSVKEGLVDSIDIVPLQPYEKLHTYYQCADIGLMLPYKGPNEENLTIGNTRKNMDYIKASLPVIVPDLGDIGLLVRQEECGVIVPSCNAESISRAVLSLLDNPDIAEKMGRNGHNAFLKKYNWNIEKKKLLKVYQAV